MLPHLCLQRRVHGQNKDRANIEVLPGWDLWVIALGQWKVMMRTANKLATMDILKAVYQQRGPGD